MFERFSKSAVECVDLAGRLAAQYGSPEIRPAHFLLAWTRTEPEFAAGLGADPEVIQAHVSAACAPSATELGRPLSRAMKACLARCAAATASRPSTVITGTDLLSALAEDASAELLKVNGQGDTLADMRENIRGLCEARSAEERPAFAGRLQWHIRGEI